MEDSGNGESVSTGALLLYPGRERIVDVALWRGRNSNLGQGLEVKVPCSSNNSPC